MKTAKNLYPQVCSLENLLLAHRNARKGKGWYQEVRMMEADMAVDEAGIGTYIPKLQEAMRNRQYQTSPYERFIKNDYGKPRIIYRLPYFPDRVAQWAILQVVEPILLRTFTDDTYSAIPGRGIHLPLKRIERVMRNDLERCQYCLKLDVKHFYQTINHEILKDHFRRLVSDPDLIWIIEEIIDSISTAEPEDYQRIDKLLPPDDWLLSRWAFGRHETPGQRRDRYLTSAVGVPIGNYLSQYCGNLYLSAFDHWIKEEKHVKHYFRYMDDMVFFSNSKEELHQLRREIDTYLQTRLRLTVKDNWQVFPTYKRGVDFLGYRIFLHYTLLRKSTCKKFKNKMFLLERKRSKGKELNYSDFCSFNSYGGWLKTCDSYRLRQKYMVPLQRYVNAYYINNLKGKKHERTGQCYEYRKTGTG